MINQSVITNFNFPIDLLHAFLCLFSYEKSVVFCDGLNLKNVENRINL